MQQSLPSCMLFYLKFRSKVEEKRKKKKEENIGFCKQRCDWFINLNLYLCILSVFSLLLQYYGYISIFGLFFSILHYFACDPFTVIIFLSVLLLVATELQIIYINTSVQP